MIFIGMIPFFMLSAFIIFGVLNKNTDAPRSPRNN
jgi:peptidoglycan/LPS O-acetylase OafA/YrhL